MTETKMHSFFETRCTRLVPGQAYTIRIRHLHKELTLCDQLPIYILLPFCSKFPDLWYAKLERFSEFSRRPVRVIADSV